MKPVVVSRQNDKIAPTAEDKIDPKNSVVARLPGNDEEDVNSDEADSLVGPPENDESNENEDLSESKEKYDDDDKWKRFQDEARKENSLETKDRTTHQVHCPYFPGEKFEWWWVYLADKKSHNLITAPLQVCSLQDREDLQLKFTAPSIPGQYIYSVYLRSDSYMDFDQFEQIKVRFSLLFHFVTNLLSLY